MRLFDGKKVAEKILKELKTAIVGENLKPGLAVILIGEDEASKIYIRLKKEASERTGVGFELYKYDVAGIFDKEILKPSVAKALAGKQVQDDVLRKISALNKRKDITGIIVQLPLPPGLDKDKIINAIAPSKDADGFHPQNRQLVAEFKHVFDPVFPTAILMAVREGANHNLKGKSAVALVNSDTFGQVLKSLFEREGVAFKYIARNVCQIGGEENDLKSADIVITARGCPALLTGEMIKNNAIVIDGGIYRAKGGKIVGDVERQSVEKKAYFLTPVPGGIGPLNIALLLKNVVLASRRQS